MQIFPKNILASRNSLLMFALTVSIVLSGCATQKLQTVKVEAEANEIIDVLSENGVTSHKTETGEGERKTYDVLVDGGETELKAAIQLLEDHCLPRVEEAPIEGGSVITSLEVERARNERRTRMGIESQLRQLPGVTCVSVNFVPPQDRTLAINPYASKASVLVTYKTPTFPFTNEQIASLVSGSVPALKLEDIMVVVTPRPLRPLPNLHSSENFTRVALVAGIGAATIAAFVSIIFLMQRKRRKTAQAEIAEHFEEENTDKNANLLKHGYDFEEDDENDGINLP